jgi:propanol-preferring alcohol dehydrogenase
VPIFGTVPGGKSIIGSIVGTRQDLAEVFALHTAGRTRVISQTRKLDEVNTCFDEILVGTVPGGWPWPVPARAVKVGTTD